MVRRSVPAFSLALLLAYFAGGGGAAAKEARWESYFTAVSAAPEQIFFAGVKRQKKSEGLVSSLLELAPRGNGKPGQKRIALPKAIRDREVRALLSDATQVLLVSQWVIEQGDEPKVHRFDRKTRKWLGLGTVDCPLLQALRVEKNLLVFECEGADQAKVERSLAFKKEFSGAAVRIELPQSRAKAGEWEAELQGPVFEFDRLELRSGSGKKIIRTASSLGGA